MVQQWGSSRSSSPRRSSYSSTKVAVLEYLPSGLLLKLDAPFDKAFTESMKASIPSKKRSFDANDKVWYIVQDQYDKLASLLEKFFSETVLKNFPVQDVSTDSWGKLFLVPGAPIEVIRSVYKTLAMLYHPDRGGDAEKMKLINVAYHELLGGLINGD